MNVGMGIRKLKGVSGKAEECYDGSTRANITYYQMHSLVRLSLEKANEILPISQSI